MGDNENDDGDDDDDGGGEIDGGFGGRLKAWNIKSHFFKVRLCLAVVVVCLFNLGSLDAYRTKQQTLSMIKAFQPCHYPNSTFYFQI